MKVLAFALVAAALVLGLVPGTGAPSASAAARVSVANTAGDAVIDPTYATTLTVKGSGFQSISGGYGGIYVLFGVLKGTWRPSEGGKSGVNYLTVPDTESKDNAGYATFVAFPGSDTEGSANGGTISARGTWSATLRVPGGTFSTTDASSKVVEVDCRVSVCGVITIGAHGVANGRNETFTRIRVGKVGGAGAGSPRSAAVPGSTTDLAPTTSSRAPARPAAAVAPALDVDRASAKPGRALSFSAVGLRPGIQVTATFDDGAAAVGPLTVGADGQVAGVLLLPTGLSTGTYQLRIVGGDDQPSVRFAVVAPEVAAATGEGRSWSLVFLAIGASTLVVASALVGLRRRRWLREV